MRTDNRAIEQQARAIGSGGKVDMHLGKNPAVTPAGIVLIDTVPVAIARREQFPLRTPPLFKGGWQGRHSREHWARAHDAGRH